MNPSWREDAPANLVKLAVGRCLAAEMDDGGRWTELALLTDTEQLINSHPRLLRSLRFGDDDYEACVFSVVPDLLNERSDPDPDPWQSPWDSPPDPPPRSTLHERFPNLVEVSDYVGLPAWLATEDERLFARLFVADADATLPDGTVLTAAESAAARLEVAEMRRQVDRIRRDHSTDPEAAIGQAKELVETVCKTILGISGGDEGSAWTFPKLVKRTLVHLGIDPTQLDGDAVQVKAARQLVGGVSSVLNGADELRNARGTGHGRSRSPLVDEAVARLAVGVALAAAVYLVEVYDQQAGTGPTPTLVERQGASPGPIAAGAVVEHRPSEKAKSLRQAEAGRSRWSPSNSGSKSDANVCWCTMRACAL